jgi:hypothetical protein
LQAPVLRSLLCHEPDLGQTLINKFMDYCISSLLVVLSLVIQVNQLVDMFSCLAQINALVLNYTSLPCTN